MSDTVCWKCDTCRGSMYFEGHVYCGDCYEDEIHEVAHKRLEEVNRLMLVLKERDAEIERLKEQAVRFRECLGHYNDDNLRVGDAINMLVDLADRQATEIERLKRSLIMGSDKK